MRALVVAAVLVVSPIAIAKGKGALIDMDVKQTALADVTRTLSDVGRFNVVLLEGADTKVDVQAKTVPWDDVVASANLAMVREGNLFVVGSREAITARKAQKKPRYSGPVLDLAVVGVEPRDVATLIAVATGRPIVLEGGDAATIRLRKVPSDLAHEMVMLQTGAKIGEPPPRQAPPAKVKPGDTKPAKATTICAAAKLPVADLELIGVVAAGTKRWAMFGTKTSAETFIVDKAGCLGVEGLDVRYIGFDALDAGARSWKLHPDK
jgi:hypothetical protein